MSATSDDSSDTDQVEMTHSDDTYAKRHQKYEIEEKRLVRKDKLMKETRQKVDFYSKYRVFSIKWHPLITRVHIICSGVAF